jgi:hypothetical protein
MFGLFSKRKNLTVHEVGHIIERFLSKSPRYPQEWNAFVDVKQRRPESERLRRRCHVLDPLVNRPGDGDEPALVKLRTMAAEARKEHTWMLRRCSKTSGRYGWPMGLG